MKKKETYYQSLTKIALDQEDLPGELFHQSKKDNKETATRLNLLLITDAKLKKNLTNSAMISLVLLMKILFLNLLLLNARFSSLK